MMSSCSISDSAAISRHGPPYEFRMVTRVEYSYPGSAGALAFDVGVSPASFDAVRSQAALELG